MMNTYKVEFEEDNKDLRKAHLELINNVCCLPETENGSLFFNVPDEAVEAVEYELRKAERKDGYCKWEKIWKKVGLTSPTTFGSIEITSEYDTFYLSSTDDYSSIGEIQIKFDW